MWKGLQHSSDLKRLVSETAELDVESIAFEALEGQDWETRHPD